MTSPSLDILESPLLAQVDEIIARAYQVKAPPPDFCMSAWADENYRLSYDNNAEGGDWHTSRNPLLREIMDCCSDPLVPEVTFMKPAQIGGTESLVNITVGYHVDQDPSSILAIFENDKKMEAWSIERLSQMIAVNPCLRNKINTDKGPNSGNKISYKKFPGGYLAIANAGSEGDLSSRPVRIVLKDELDKWKTLNAGDPDRLADARTSTFLTRAKIINLSTPRDHDPEPQSEIKSRIYTKYLASDMRKPYVPCPFCGHYQNIRHDQVKFERPGNARETVSAVWIECENPACAIKKIKQQYLPDMRRRGKWVAEKPFAGHAGFGHYLPFLSPWVTLKKYAEEFLRSKRQRDTFKTFVNEWMGMPWNPNMLIDTEEKTSPYLRRRESYEKVPWGAAPFLYSFADVQKDRIEVITCAFGMHYEMWGVHLEIFWGETSLLDKGTLPPVWQKLEEYRHRTWEHESGESCRIVRMFIDAGYIQSVVLKFCRGKRPQVWPSKGMSDKDVRAPFVSRRPKTDKANKMIYYPIGVNEGKELIFSNFSKELPEIKEGELPPSVPGLMHFNQFFDIEFFKQLLVSERPVWKGRIQVFEKISAAARNEGLDLVVGVRACYESTGIDSKPYVEAMRKRWEEVRVKGQGSSSQENQAPDPGPRTPNPAAKRRGNWVTGWKR